MGSCRKCSVWHLGVCTDMDYCRAERESLMEGAQQLAEQRGHALTAFVRVEQGLSIFQCQCMHCGKTVVIDVNPDPGEKDMYGEALIIICIEFDGDQDDAKANDRAADESAPDWARART